MKVELKTVTEKEITFPCFYVRRYQHTSNEYFLFTSETSGIKIEDGLTEIKPPKTVCFDSLELCNYEDIEMMKKWFISNQAKFNSILYPIDATDHNLPTEELVMFKSNANYKLPTDKDLENELHRQAGLYGN